MKTYGTLILSATWQLAAVPHVAMRVKRVFESIAKDQHGVIQIPDTPGNARDLLWFGRNRGTWDGERLRSVAAEVHKRSLLPNAFKRGRTA